VDEIIFATVWTMPVVDSKKLRSKLAGALLNYSRMNINK